jgi:PKD repeat protein
MRSAAGATLAFFLAAFLPCPEARLEAADQPASPLVITHDPLACVTTTAPPVVEAAVSPDRELAKSFVYFRAAGTEDFYYVVMGGGAAALEAILPRPLPETKGIDYRVQAVDRGELTKRTPDYQPPVVQDNVCRSKKPAARPGGVTVGLTREGQSPVPPGFNRADIVRVILVSGAVVSLAVALQSGGAAAAAGSTAASTTTTTTTVAAGTGGGGLSTTAVVVGGVVVAGGAAAVIANNAKSSSNSAPTISISAAPSSGSAPLAVTFTASVTDKQNDTPYAVAWTFGDGATGTGSTATHTYSAPGNYSVSATATDRKGKHGLSNTLTIAVSAPPPVSFIVASVSWSGHADVNLVVFTSSDSSVGQNIPAGCETDANRTEQVVMQGSDLAAGSYSVNATATACPTGTPPSSVTAVASVVTSSGTFKCSPATVSIPTDGSRVLICSFSIP